jgi:hypothetical protein
MPADYNVAFDVAQTGSRHLWFLAPSVFFLALGVILFVFRKRASGVGKFFAYMMLPFAAFWTLASSCSLLAGYSSLASALRSGRCQVAEGEITQFHPMPAQGHEWESFVVGSKRFEYSDFVLSPGFHNTSSHGGPIREGLRVRIHYLGNDIARLEIAKP